MIVGNKKDQKQYEHHFGSGYNTDVEAAKALAKEMHNGQTDKAGKPYITHPERVASRLETKEAQVVGWLHDTVEDTALTLMEIEEKFGQKTAAAVDAVSRRESESSVT